MRTHWRGRPAQAITNLVDVLDGTLIVGDIEKRFEQGSVVVAAANPDVLEGLYRAARHGYSRQPL